MKKITILFTLILIVVFSTIVNAQVPQKVNYQAVARNSSGAILVTQPVGIRLSVHDGSASGPIV